jgi:hypothetical protein
MIYTTLKRIRAHSPCAPGWEKLLRGLGKTAADDAPVGFDEILRINGADDAFWCLRAEPQHDRLWRALAVRCARQVQHLMTDQRSLDALDIAERHSLGEATDAELDAAWDAARAAALAAASYARDAAWDAARAAARAAACDAACDAMDAGGTSACLLLSTVSSYHSDPGGRCSVKLEGGE